MVNKIKTRRVKRTKYSKRKKFSKYRKQYTRKFVKRFQTRIKRRRQTRRKVGGFSFLQTKITPSREFNFSLPNQNSLEIKAKGLALVTKLGSLLSKSNRPEQVIIYQHKDKEEKASGNYFIARCVSSECADGINMESKILETMQLDMMSIKGNVVYEFTTINGDKYQIILTKPLTFDSIQSNKRHEVHKVKVKHMFGNNDVSVSINTKNDTPYSMSMTIDGKVKKFSLINPIFNEYIKIDDICYASYNFHTIDDADATMEIFVPVSSEEGSIFQIVNPTEANYLKDSPIFPCDEN